MPLQLRYNFTPKPNPITASVAGPDPSFIDLQVMISTPTNNPIQLTAISITIPCGEGGANTLSDYPNLPAPNYDSNTGWSLSDFAGGDTVAFNLPASGFAGLFIFILPAIQVNQTPSLDVPITIVEDGPPKVSDSTTYSLVIQPSDFPITNFYPHPAILNDLDQTVTLKWYCSAQKSEYSYSVHSDSWQPDDCLNGGNCYTCTDGAKGIQTDPLNETTTFALDVIKANADGSRSIYQTLKTTVHVITPSISDNSYYESYLSGRVVRLHWLAFNSAYCTVLLDGEVIVANAPTDTYTEGYWIVLSEPEGPHQLTVTAHAASGSTQSSYIFPDVNLFPITTNETGGGYSIAITPDGSTALILSEQSLVSVDIATGTVNTTVNVPDTTGLAITPDGTHALLAPGPAAHPGQVSVINLPGLTVEQNIQLGVQPNGIAITPDGTLALLTAFDAQGNSVMAVIDIASMTVEPNTIPVGNFPEGPVITPDGTLALTVNYNDNSVTVVDIASRSAVATIPVGTGPIGISLSADGSTALTANTGDSNIASVIDVASRRVIGNITADVMLVPNNIVILPTPANGALGMVIDDDAATLTFIDVANLRVLSPPLKTADSPTGIAAMPDGSHVLITSLNTPALTQL